jgi:hypothetical protein
LNKSGSNKQFSCLYATIIVYNSDSTGTVCHKDETSDHIVIIWNSAIKPRNSVIPGIIIPPNFMLIHICSKMNINYNYCKIFEAHKKCKDRTFSHLNQIIINAITNPFTDVQTGSWIEKRMCFTLCCRLNRVAVLPIKKCNK